MARGGFGRSTVNSSQVLAVAHSRYLCRSCPQFLARNVCAECRRADIPQAARKTCAGAQAPDPFLQKRRRAKSPPLSLTERPGLRRNQRRNSPPSRLPPPLRSWLLPRRQEIRRKETSRGSLPHGETAKTGLSVLRLFFFGNSWTKMDHPTTKPTLKKGRNPTIRWERKVVAFLTLKNSPDTAKTQIHLVTRKDFTQGLVFPSRRCPRSENHQLPGSRCGAFFGPSGGPPFGIFQTKKIPTNVSL